MNTAFSCIMDKGFLPASLEEGKKHYRDFSEFDVVFVTGDPYYDHPLSGMAIISRLLDKKGYKVGIIAQPLGDEDYKACGRPKYFFCITSGLLDSMLANYTPMLKKRENILVPERGLMVYTQKLKEHFKGCMTIIGGVEATLRRFTHFDYKDNKLRRGILNDTKADLLLFGNAERSILTLLERMKKINDLTLPTLNMYGSQCALYKHESKIYSPIIEEKISVYDKKDYCNQQCVGCQFRVLSDDLFPLLEEVEKLNQKHANTSLELRSAIRHDIILGQKKLFRKIMQFVARLKIAPENLSDSVLKQMNKATASAFREFLEEYKKVNEEQKTNKNLVPYFVAAHPGSTKEDMEETKKFCKENDIFVNLTQVFTPTPGTLSTAMYYTGENPMTKEKIHVPRSFREKKDQKNILLSKDDEFADDNG